MHPLIYPAAPAGHDFLPSFWWLLPLLVLFLLTGTLLFYRLRKHTPAEKTTVETTSQLSEALAELQNLTKPAAHEQSGPLLQQLNLLLKRFCAARYPDIATHRLSGREWLAFLDSRCPAAGLTRWMILTHGSYLPDCRLSESDIEDLHKAISIWMRAHV